VYKDLVKPYLAAKGIIQIIDVSNVKAIDSHHMKFRKMEIIKQNFISFLEVPELRLTIVRLY